MVTILRIIPFVINIELINISHFHAKICMKTTSKFLKHFRISTIPEISTVDFSLTVMEIAFYVRSPKQFDNSKKCMLLRKIHPTCVTDRLLYN